MRDMLKLWKNLFEKLPNAVIIDKKYGYFYISNLLWYLDSKLPVEMRDALSDLMLEHLPKDDGEKLMKIIADDYIEQGVHKGILIGEARGLEKTAIRMLKGKTDIKFIASVTGLSTDEILKL